MTDHTDEPELTAAEQREQPTPSIESLIQARRDRKAGRPILLPLNGTNA